MTKKKSNNIGDMILIDTVYRPSIGSFGKPNGIKNERYVVKNWYHCREIWHNQMYNAKLFFYAHPVSRNKSLNAFFEKIETILNVQEKSIFGPTQKKHIMYVKPSKWWLKYTMRRSLFTILLRSSSSYDISLDNFEDALYSNFYAERTRKAIQYFLQGNTVYKGKRRGWHRQFGEVIVTEESLKKLLVPENLTFPSQ